MAAFSVEVYGTVPLLGDETRAISTEGFSGVKLLDQNMNIVSPPAQLVLELYQGFRLQGTALGRERIYHTRTFRRVLLTATRVVYVEEP